MALKTVSSKIISSETVTPQLNNYVKEIQPSKLCAITNSVKILIKFEAIFGLNRFYLLEKKWFKIFGSIYSYVLATTLIYFAIVQKSINLNMSVLKWTNTIEVILLKFSVDFIEKNNMRKYFKYIENVDDMMGLQNEKFNKARFDKGSIWIVVLTTYFVVECAVSLANVQWLQLPLVIWFYIGILAHDCEHIYLCTLIRGIIYRLKILEAHISALLKLKVDPELAELYGSRVEQLSGKTHLDITAVHDIYEMLHKCSKKVKRVISFPMAVMLVCSGISITFLSMALMNYFKSQNQSGSMYILVFCLARCLNYIFILVFPCYYSNQTVEHVHVIQILLHDAINLGNLERLERRKVKALYQLTRDSEFQYSVWGVFMLNMAMPLKFISICTTYFVIINQFSKVFDDTT